MIMIAALASGLSMCATEPPAAPADTAQTGPDGLIIRHAPTESIDSGALPLPELGAEADAEG
jgi:hypothetical protein